MHNLGAFSDYSTTISAEAMEAYKQAMDGIVGVSYTPLAVSAQVMAGANYSFFCNYEVVHPDAEVQACLLSISAPQGKKQNW